MNSEIERIKTQLAIAHWNLDAAASHKNEVLRDYFDQAERAYQEALALIARSNLGVEERHEIERALEGVRIRLEPAWEP